jgi:hypothetical protein
MSFDLHDFLGSDIAGEFECRIQQNVLISFLSICNMCD